MRESNSQTELEPSFLIESVKQWYRVRVVGLCRLPSDTGKYIYRVKLESGTERILRAAKEPGKATLVNLINLLHFFEQQDYPAERAIVTAKQTSLAHADDWHFVMTTYLAGTPLEYTPSSFALLGTRIGRLHALKLVHTYSPPCAGMLPAGELAYAQQQLAAIASMVPRRYLAQYELLQSALASIDHGTDVPATLIHNDCHPANALLTGPEQVTLFDWEGAGMGPASLDVGFLLANCDGKAPWDPLMSVPFQLNEPLLHAVIDGYCRHRQLTIEELDHLPDAIRFRSLVYGACRFAVAIAQGEEADFTQWWWLRYRVAEEIADNARAYFK